MQRGGSHKTLFLAEELLALDDYQVGSISFLVY